MSPDERIGPTAPEQHGPVDVPASAARVGGGLYADLALDYELLGELGRGGSAVVYRARDRRLGREVALKVVRVAPALAAGASPAGASPAGASPAGAGAEAAAAGAAGTPEGADGGAEGGGAGRRGASEAVARLGREARTIAALEHPHIVRVHAVRELPDGLALEMPLIRGRTLKQLLAEEGPLAPERAARLLGDVARALAFAHARGVVHRDVKPENVFVEDATGHALLADFGVARSAEADAPEARLTQTGVTLGTPAYMSPEQIEGHTVDGRSDVYSLGLLGWELLTGQRPWAGAGLFAVLQRQQQDALPPIEVVRPAGLAPVPLALQYVLERMMQKAPAARWAGADAVAAQLANPILPSDFAKWQRAHARRVAEAREGPARPGRGGGLVAAALTTMRLTRRLPATRAADDADAAAASLVADAEPSWTSEPEAPAGRGRRVALGTALAGLTAVALLAPRLREQVPAWRNQSVAVSDAPARVSVPIPALPVPPDQPAAASVAPRDVDAAVAAGARAADTLLAAPADTSPPSLPKAPVTSAPTPSVSAPANGLPSIGTSARGGVRTTAVASPAPAPPAAAPPAAGTPAPPTLRPVAVAIPTVSTAAVSNGTVAPAAGSERLAVTFERPRAAAGGRHSCAVLAGGQLACWGANDAGQLGTGDFDARDEPAPVVSELRFSQVSAGGTHSCGVTADGSTYCWGEGARGQLGSGIRNERPLPARVSGGWNFRGVRAGLAHTCGIAADGTVLCWGANDNGQLGDNTTRDRPTPAPVPGLRAASLTVGWRHSCALTADGAASCWGENGDGQLGDGTRTPRRAPAPIGNGLRFASLSAGAAHTCGITTDGRTFCWGRNGAGQLGNGSTATHLLPTLVDTPARFVTLVTGSTHTCGRSAAGLVFCWGGNAYGQLGDGTTMGHTRPVRVTGGPYAALSASGAHTCATVDGAAVCWGYNVDGQLGDGTRAHRASPMRVTAAAH